MLSFQFLTTFYSCSSDSSVREESESLSVKTYNKGSFFNDFSDYWTIGRLHNEGLEYVYSEIVSKNNFTLMDFSNMLTEVKKGTYNFTKGIDFSKHISYSDYLSIYSMYDNVLYSQFVDIKKGDYDFNMVDSIKKEVSLTSKQEKYLLELDTVISNYDLDSIQLLEELSKLKREIVTHCSKEEQFILLASVSIAINSLEYWTVNLDKWMSIGNNRNTILSKGNRNDEEWRWFKSTIKSMGKSDVVGGIIGGASGALAGGVGAAPGAVGGACYASAGRAIVALTERWGLW